MLALLIACAVPSQHGAQQDSPVFPEVPGPDLDPPLPVQVDPMEADYVWRDSENELAIWAPKLMGVADGQRVLSVESGSAWRNDARAVRFMVLGGAGWDVEGPTASFTTTADFQWSSWDQRVVVGGDTPGLLVGARENSELANQGGTLFFLPADSVGEYELETWSWRWEGAIEYESLGEKLGWVGDPVGDGHSYLAATVTLEEGSVSVVLLAVDEPGAAPESAAIRIDPILYPSDEVYAGTSFTGADLNGDGVGDLVIGNRLGNTGEDEAGWVATFDGPIPTGSWRPSDYSRRWHRTDYLAWLGAEVVNAGDLTGDGLDDLVATSWDWAQAGASMDVYGLPKHAYVIPGGAESGEVESAAVAEFVESDVIPEQDEGLEISIPGDVDGDSVPDLLIGSQDVSGPDPDNREDRGSVWLFSGTSRGTTEMTWYAQATVFTGSPGENLHDVTGGDLDADGLSDLVLGSNAVADDGSVGTLYTFLAPI